MMNSYSMVNSGAGIVRGLKKVLDGLSGVGSYIDDTVLYKDSWEEHLRTLKNYLADWGKLESQAHLRCLLGANSMEFF